MNIDTRKILSANEFQLVDSKGNVKAVFAANESGVELSMMDSNGKKNLKMMVDNSGLSFLKMFDQDSDKEKIDISVDSQGAHLYLTGEDKQQSYLFLKKNGASGVVLIDKEGQRRAQVLISPEGNADISTSPKK